MAIVLDGATGVLGSQLAQLLDASGEHLLLLGRNEEKLEELRDSLTFPNNHEAYVWKNGDTQSLQSIFSLFAEKQGNIDSLVVASGEFRAQPIINVEDEEFLDLFKLNVERPLKLMKAFRLSAHRSAETSVVLISSVAALGGEAGIGEYGATKAALESLAKTCAIEFSKDRIRVNAVRAGLFESQILSNMQDKYGVQVVASIISKYPLGLGSAGDVAKVVMFLVSANAKWMTGSILNVDGGRSVVN